MPQPPVDATTTTTTFNFCLLVYIFKRFINRIPARRRLWRRNGMDRWTVEQHGGSVAVAAAGQEQKQKNLRVVSAVEHEFQNNPRNF